MSKARLSQRIFLKWSLALVLVPGSVLHAQEPSAPANTVVDASPAQTPDPKAPQTQPAAPFGSITGTVSSGKLPLPGVTITASNTLTGKKYITSSDLDGSFKVDLEAKGRYVLKAELSAFAPVTQEVVINAENPSGKAELSMILLSRAESEAQKQQQQLAAGLAGRGMQSLSVAGSDMAGVTGASGGGTVDLGSASGLPNAGLAAEGNTESVAVSGATGRSEQPTFDEGEMQDRIAELRDQMARQGGGGINGGNVAFLGGGGMGGMGGGGGMGGMGGGGPIMIMMGGGGGGGRGGRGGRNFNVNKPHGSLFYSMGNSALDAAPYSLSGQPATKPSYQQSRFGGTVGGPLNIPHIYNGGTKTFAFLNYSGSRSANPYDVFSTVPTLAERGGDFSQSQVFSGAGSAAPVQIFDPATHTPFAGNVIPSARINSASLAALSFIPLPNLPGAKQNFHYVSSSGSNSDTLALRLNHTFGAAPASGQFGPRAQRREQRQQNSKTKKSTGWRQSINGGFNYNSASSRQLNPFPTLGGHSANHNYNANTGYNLSKNRFFNSLSFTYNRSNNEGTNQFTNKNNIAAALGITGVSTSPADFGLPNFSFTHYQGIRDTTPQFRTNQTFNINDSMNWSRGKHSFSWGGNYRRLLLDLSNAANARGSFVFTGIATQGPAANSGYDLADFLLGLPQQSSLQFGTNSYQFRSNAFNLYVQDNWKAANNVTLNLGLRYEYTSPYTEAHNRLANLDAAPGFTAVSEVLPGQTGPFTGKFPASLIKPDRNNFAPRLGLAWKPFSRTVVRSGYGINYNIGQYGGMVTQLAFQPPFAVTQTNNSSPQTPLTLQNGFPAPTAAVTNSYGVDPNYRLAYVQSWNLDIQQDLTRGMILNVGYTGSKGTHLDIVRAPNRAPPGTLGVLPSGLLIPGVQPFNWESSEGSSILHAGTLRMRKRMQHGFSLGGSYSFSKSVDDASSIGGGATVVAQNDRDLAAERSLSSFDQRHRFTADYLYELPFGLNRRWLNGTDWKARAFGSFQWSGSLTLASGTPFTARVIGDRTVVSQGANGSLRANYDGLPIHLSDPTVAEWFNTAAFTTPSSGSFGDAGRNTIIGPGTVAFDMAFSKNIPVTETQGLEIRISANNIFNNVHFSSIDTAVDSPTFGRVLSVGSMRKAQISARYHF